MLMPFMTAGEVALRTLYVLHVAAGVLSLPTGYLALSASKGSALHRKSGMLFVCTMLATSTLGAILAVARHKIPEVNVPAAVLSSYFVITSLVSVRPIPGWTRRYDIGFLIAVLTVALLDLALGVVAVAQGGRWHGTPAFPFFMFGVVGLIAAGGDLRMLRSGALGGSRRVARHLWRMSFALLFASLSLGQVKVLPAAIRTGPVLAIPPLLVLVVMLWWLWRVRGRWAMGGARRTVTVTSRSS
jgi:uncharacterized membrane protein